MPDGSQSVSLPGLRGQEHGDIRATIYRRGSDLLQISSSPIPLDGRTERDIYPSIIAAQIQQSLGQPGTWQLSVKAPSGQNLLDFFDDDDWIDIELGRNGVFWHVMRGLLDEIRCSTNVAGNGATSRTFLLAGQSFQKVWAQTPMWFSSVFAEDLSLLKNQGSIQDTGQIGIGRNVPGTIASFLYSYTNRVAQAKRSSVSMPSDMPGVTSDFSSSWRQDETQFDDSDAPRQNLMVNAFSPSQSVWDVATQWSDPYYVEMFTALLPAVPAFAAEREGKIDRIPQLVNSKSAVDQLGPSYDGAQNILGLTAMTLVVRNKPFINVDPENSSRLGLASPWFSLPTLYVDPQDLVTLDVGRNGYERANAFFSGTQVLSAVGEAPLDSKMAPLWNVDDMRVHGMRILDVSSLYFTKLSKDTPGLDDLSQEVRLRARIRDYCMANAFYLNGSIGFASSYPEVQVGTRVRISYPNIKDQLTFYIESVTHSFSAQGGWRTSLGVTRGYAGSDRSHLAFLSSLRAQYSKPF